MYRKHVRFKSLILSIIMVLLTVPLNVLPVKAAYNIANHRFGAPTSQDDAIRPILDYFDDLNKNMYVRVNGVIHFLNPFTAKAYAVNGDYLLVYGDLENMSDNDFKEKSNGKYVRNGKKGEYRYLGYSETGLKVTNDKFPNDNDTTNTNINTWVYTTDEIQSGTWANLDELQKSHLKTKKVIDEDTVTNLTLPQVFASTKFASNETIEDYVEVQVAPDYDLAGNVLTRFYRGNDLRYNTLTMEGKLGIFEPSLSLSTSSSSYTIKSTEKSITIPVTATINFRANSSNIPMDLITLTKIKTGDNSYETISTDTRTSYSITQDYIISRSDIGTGSKTITINADAHTKNKYNNERDLTASKTITVTVEETTEPYVSVDLTTNPSTIQYTGSDMIVGLTADWDLHNWTDMSQISNMNVKFYDGNTLIADGSFTGINPSTAGSKTMLYIIPASFMSGYTERTKQFKAEVYYTPKDDSDLKTVNSENSGEALKGNM